MHEAGKGAERDCGEVIAFEATERERTACERERHRHPVYYTKGGLRSRHRSPRHQQAVQLVEVEIDTESIEQVERSNGGHRQTNHECQT